MDTYLSLDEAQQITQVTPRVLNELVLSGKIRSVMLANGSILVNSKDVRVQIPITARAEYAAFSHLAGVPISMSEAARRYCVHQQTFSRWVRDGLIARMGTSGRQVLIDEAQAATAAKIYLDADGGHGRWVFKDGLPYQKKDAS
jgi:predicted site-specific integrase-resolvase